MARRCTNRFVFCHPSVQAAPRTAMKLVVFAHVPPPHHGQSQMVQYLVDGFRADPAHGIEVLHVDARLSDDLTDVGSARGGKLTKLLGYVRAAKCLGREHNVRTLYYVPSPPKRNSLYRDWIVLALLRPWFRNVIFHWHAVGLGQWLEDVANPVERAISRRLLGWPALNLILSTFNRPDADKFQPKAVAIVPNGVPDPCPEFDLTLAEHRRRRLAGRLAQPVPPNAEPSDSLAPRGTSGERAGERGSPAMVQALLSPALSSTPRGREGVRPGDFATPVEVKVLFLALCSRDKGVLDAVEAVRLANELGARLARPLKFRLLVAGTFPTPDVEADFKRRLTDPALAACVSHTGFLGPEAKASALRDSDVFLFPSYFANEGQPLNLIEAMAFGLPLVSTRWRGIPEMLPENYAGLVEPRDPAAAARALITVVQTEDGLRFRERFLERYQLAAHLRTLAAALKMGGGT
jgi:glycosyltransferase involved in cell wall biosynthesis